MSCCPHPSKTAPPQKSKVTTEEEILSIPAAQLTLVDSNDSLELCHGVFTILKLIQEGSPIAIIVKVDDDYRWPLTKDEPVVKLDDLHYLFTVKPPSTEQKKKAEFISYGIKFSERSRAVDALDSFLIENSCFTAPKVEAAMPVAEADTKVSCWAHWKGLEDDNWKKYAPNVDNYHGILAKAIASGSDKVLEALEVAGRNALSVTAGATTKMVSNKFGEEAGNVTDDVLATAGHALGTVSLCRKYGNFSWRGKDENS